MRRVGGGLVAASPTVCMWSDGGRGAPSRKRRVGDVPRRHLLRRRRGSNVFCATSRHPSMHRAPTTPPTLPAPSGAPHVARMHTGGAALSGGGLSNPGRSTYSPWGRLRPNPPNLSPKPPFKTPRPWGRPRPNPHQPLAKTTFNVPPTHAIAPTPCCGASSPCRRLPSPCGGASSPPASPSSPCLGASSPVRTGGEGVRTLAEGVRAGGQVRSGRRRRGAWRRGCRRW
jgi:hypothetical protein